MKHSRWNLLPPAGGKYLAEASAPSPLIAQLLYNRGLTDPARRESFIAADRHLLADPFLLPGIEPAVARLYQALLSGEKVAVYGDFDVDGITATALLVQGMESLGADVIPYIPHRMTEGYGLRTAALEKLSREGVGLVVTVDCGITAIPEVERARRMGLDIIITDHHTPLPETPPAVATVNPRLPGSAYPFLELAGVGVAYKLLQALLQGVGKEAELEGLLDLVALGTVADMVPLLEENRCLVKEGLKSINASPRLGLREIITRAGLPPGGVDSESISWVIAPRLNAAGRVAHALSSYRLLMTDSPPEAEGLTMWLEQKNAERQRLTERVLARAREQILAEGVSPLLLASDKDYPAGVVGLVAGRLSEEFYRPTIIVKSGEQVSSGSCRSIPEFNIVLALRQCRDLLSHFGGHSRAAGFTLPTRNLPRLKQRLLELAVAQLEGVDLRPRLDVEAEVTLPELGGDAFQAIRQLAPFGQGNPVPTFLSRGVKVIDCHTMGNSGEHLRLKLEQGNTVWDGVAFRVGDYLAEVSSPLDIVYNVEMDRWGGGKRLRLNIQDFAPV